MITMGDMKWYVLRTAGSKEKKAKDYLEKEIERFGLQDQVAQVLVPVKREIVTKNGKRKVVERLLYPGYVLIQAQLCPELEYIIRNDIPGMSGFLTEKKTSGTMTERVPVPIRDDEAQWILGNQDQNVDNPVETEVNFEVGESVKITDGPFSGFSGTVDAIEEDRSKLKVIVVIFGRKTLLELSFTQVTGFIKLQIKAGAANPAPPVGPALGSKGLNIMDFCKQFNAATQQSAGKILPVVITVYSDKSFTFEVKQPPVAISLKEAAKIQKGSGEPNRRKVASITWDQVKTIAEGKMPDLNANDIEAAKRIIAGTARSMGVEVEK